MSLVDLMSSTTPLRSSDSDRLHKWVLWRMSINQELIQGIEGDQPGPEGHAYSSFLNDSSITQRYIQNPDLEKEQTYYVRNTYGMPPSPRYPIGNTLFLLYGLPRAKAVRMPTEMMKLHHSVPDLTSLEFQEQGVNLSSRDNVSVPLRAQSPQPVHYIQSRNNLSDPARVRSPKPFHNLQSRDNIGTPTRARSPAPLHNIQEEHTEDQKKRQVSTPPPPPPPPPPLPHTPGKLQRPMTYMDRVSELDSKRGQNSLMNFPDKPETEFTQAPPTVSETVVNNINKPVVVPPSVFRKEVLRRSNIDLPLNIKNEDRPRKSHVSEDGFEDPRGLVYYSNRNYAWSEMSGKESRHWKPYIDDSQVKTHL